MFSRPLEIEHYRQYLLLRTDNSQKAVVECPCILEEYKGYPEIFSLSRVFNLSSQNLPLRKSYFTGNSRWVTMIICLKGEGRITLKCSTEQYCSRSDVHSVNFAWLNMINISR